jgi:peptidase E
MKAIKNKIFGPSPKDRKIVYIPVAACNARYAQRVDSALQKVNKNNCAALFVGINSSNRDSIV